jgi:hypothetical protein
MPSRSSTTAPKRSRGPRHLNLLLLHRRSTPSRRAARIAGEILDIYVRGVDGGTWEWTGGRGGETARGVARRGRAGAGVGERGGRPGDGARQAGLSDGARQARGRRRGEGEKKDGGFGREKRKGVFTNSSVRHLNRSGGSNT